MNRLEINIKIFAQIVIVIASIITISCRAQLTEEQKNSLSMVKLEHIPGTDFCHWFLYLEVTLTDQYTLLTLFSHNDFISAVTENEGYINYIQKKGFFSVRKRNYWLYNQSKYELLKELPHDEPCTSLPAGLNHIREPVFQKGIEIAFTNKCNDKNMGAQVDAVQNLLCTIAKNLIKEVVKDINAYLYALLSEHLQKAKPSNLQNKFITNLGIFLEQYNPGFNALGKKLLERTRSE